MPGGSKTPENQGKRVEKYELVCEDVHNVHNVHIARNVHKSSTSGGHSTPPFRVCQIECDRMDI